MDPTLVADADVDDELAALAAQEESSAAGAAGDEACATMQLYSQVSVEQQLQHAKVLRASLLATLELLRHNDDVQRLGSALSLKVQDGRPSSRLHADFCKPGEIRLNLVGRVQLMDSMDKVGRLDTLQSTRPA